MPPAVAITLPGWTSPWHTTGARRRRPTTSDGRSRRRCRPGGAVELVADASQQVVELPPRERVGGGSGYAGRQVRRVEVVHAGHHRADGPPVDGLVDRLEPLPRRHRAGRRPAPRRGAGPRRRGRRRAVRHAGQLDRRLGRRRRAPPPAGRRRRRCRSRSSRTAAAPAPAGPSARRRPTRARPVSSTGPGRRGDERPLSVAPCEHVDAGVEATGRVEALLDPAVQRDAPPGRRRRLAAGRRGGRCRRRSRRRTRPAARRMPRRRRSTSARRPAAGGGPAAGATSSSAAWSATSRSSPSSSTHVVVPSHSTDVGRYRRASASSGSSGRWNHCS